MLLCFVYFSHLLFNKVHEVFAAESHLFHRLIRLLLVGRGVQTEVGLLLYLASLLLVGRGNEVRRVLWKGVGGKR